tara:strand:- start:186 stop:683 length:498 start_codon:yes stop_codon:yes gene_type:complete
MNSKECGKLLPYRNRMERKKNFVLDKSILYKQRNTMKPIGLWYQIKDCGNIWGELDWGKHIYEVNVDTKCIYTIKNYKELLDFNKKYSIKLKNLKLRIIRWELLSKDYCGFEIKNFKKIKSLIKEEPDEKKSIISFVWFFMFDFSSGCVWDLNALKNIKYFDIKK